MSRLSNNTAIEYTKDITVAALQSQSNHAVTEKNGKEVADFMQCIYDKLVELGSEKSTD